MEAKGTFEITMQAEPPYDQTDGIIMARVSFDKTFVGAFEGTSKVHMLGARTPVQGSAGYVALERLAGKLDGKTGSFVVVQTGLMTQGKPSLTITIVPDSGTGELKGIAGTMRIDMVERQHHYTIDYSL